MNTAFFSITSMCEALCNASESDRRDMFTVMGRTGTVMVVATSVLILEWEQSIPRTAIPMRWRWPAFPPNELLHVSIVPYACAEIWRELQEVLRQQHARKAVRWTEYWKSDDSYPSLLEDYRKQGYICFYEGKYHLPLSEDIPSDPPIVEARIDDLPQQMFGPKPTVMVRYEGAEEFVRLFDYYSDDLSFVPDEFIGLTASEGHRLRHAKDVAYLRS